MKFETGQVVIAVMFFVIGWAACRGWDALVDAVFGAVDGTHALLVDVLAVIGAIAVALGIGYVVTH